jgi:hypothetical protein
VLADVALRDSRNPMLPFAPGPGRGKTGAPAIEAVAEQFAGPLYTAPPTARTGGECT